MKATLLTVLTFLTINISAAQPDIEWQSAFGGSEDDNARSIAQTSDGGYIVAGLTRSFDGDVISNNVPGRYIWIVKLDATGTIQWEKTYGGNDHDEANEIQQTSDGGYIVIGSSESNDFIGDNIGNQDIIVFKLDSNGNYLWGKRFGGTGLDSGQSIKQTTDGGYIASGSVNFPGNLANFWVAKLDGNGDIAANWSNTQFYGVDNEVALSVNQTLDGGYIVVGTADFDNGNNRDFWIIKLDVTSTIEWQKTYGGTGTEFARAVQQTSDGGYIIAGSTDSIDGDISMNYGETDFWVLKLDSSGNLIWQKTYGGSQRDVAFSILETLDGGFVVAGETASDDFDVSGNPGSNLYDYWVIKINTMGDLSWQTCLGGSGNDYGRSIIQTADQGYVVAGYAFSNNFDVSGNNGRWDFWVVKLDSETLGINDYGEHNFNLYPNPSKDKIHILTDLEFTNIEVYNNLGKLILKSNYTGHLDVSMFLNGIYLLKLTTENTFITKKIIVN